MKKLFIIIILVLGTIGCGIKTDASKAVINYLNKYNKVDSDIMKQIDYYVEQQDLTMDQKELYREILNKQYKDMEFEIVEEQYAKGSATVTVKITVYDFYRVQKECEQYLIANPDEFNDEDTQYDKTIYLDYKLDKMINSENTVDYTIDLFATKEEGYWNVIQPSNTVLEKIHGIYNYDNR